MSLSSKNKSELGFWNTRDEARRKVPYKNDHYKPFYTDFFGIDYSFYENKNILDIGCGPRGSLEWADNTKNRIGIDSWHTKNT